MHDTRPDAKLILGSQLRKARLLLELTPEEVARQIGVESKQVVDWEEERSRPNLTQIERLALIYGRGIDYFLRETPAAPGRIEFRGKPGESVRDLPLDSKAVLARFDELCRSTLELETLLGKQTEIRVPVFQDSEPALSVAHSLRTLMKANGRPLRRLRDEVERLGVRIFALPVPHDAFSGFSFWHSGYGPCILVNAKDPPGRRNFTLAHELAHLVYRQGSSVCYLPINPGNTYGHLEYRANQLAVELLMPEQGVVRNFHEVGLSLRPSEQELARFASRWGVSLQAMGYRLENLGLIEKGLIDEMLESWPKFMKRSKTPRWERQLGQRFVQVAFEAYQKGLISSGKLARTLGLTVRKVLEEADKRAS